MTSSKYLISTNIGCIPNVIDSSGIISLNKDLIIYIDDFIYRDSIFHKNNITLREFCNIQKDKRIFLMFKNDTRKKDKRTLTSKRGNIVLTKDEYMSFVDKLDADFFQDFESGLLNNKDKTVAYKVVDIKEIDEFESIGEYDYIGTSFINKITDEGKMLKLEDKKLCVVDVYDCKCCGDLKEGYLRHLMDKKEINLFYYLTVHNYNILNKYLN